MTTRPRPTPPFPHRAGTRRIVAAPPTVTVSVQTRARRTGAGAALPSRRGIGRGPGPWILRVTDSPHTHPPQHPSHPTHTGGAGQEEGQGAHPAQAPDGGWWLCFGFLEMCACSRLCVPCAWVLVYVYASPLLPGVSLDPTDHQPQHVTRGSRLTSTSARPSGRR